MSAPNSPSLFSIDAVMGMSTKEYTPPLSETGTLSSAAFAGRFVLPDISDHECSTDSTSVWSLNSESPSLSPLNRASVRCLKQCSGADEIRADSGIALNSSFTKLCLKDLPSNSYEENLFYNENKMSTPTRSPVTKWWDISTNKIYCSEKDVFDEIKVNLRIAQFLNFIPQIGMMLRLKSSLLITCDYISNYLFSGFFCSIQKVISTHGKSKKEVQKQNKIKTLYNKL